MAIDSGNNCNRPSNADGNHIAIGTIMIVIVIADSSNRVTTTIFQLVVVTIWQREYINSTSNQNRNRNSNINGNSKSNINSHCNTNKSWIHECAVHQNWEQYCGNNIVLTVCNTLYVWILKLILNLAYVVCNSGMK